MNGVLGFSDDWERGNDFSAVVALYSARLIA
jgi:hypothetical protein